MLLQQSINPIKTGNCFVTFRISFPFWISTSEGFFPSSLQNNLSRKRLLGSQLQYFRRSDVFSRASFEWTIRQVIYLRNHVIFFFSVLFSHQAQQARPQQPALGYQVSDNRFSWHHPQNFSPISIFKVLIKLYRCKNSAILVGILKLFYIEVATLDTWFSDIIVRK